MVKVSIIIPTYNRCHLLPRAIKSAQQAGTDVEVIVVDDASTDDTLEVCKSLEGIRYLRMEQNGGQAAVRNAGIRASEADYISFLDDDDMRLPGSLDKQIELLDSKSDAGFVYGQMIEVDVTLVNEPMIEVGAESYTSIGQITPAQCLEGDVFWKLLEFNFVPVLTVVARKQCVIGVGMFDPRFTGVEDWDLWLRLAEQFCVFAVKEPVAIYSKANWSSGQMTSNQAAILTTKNRVQKHALQLPRSASALGWQRRQARQRFLNQVSDVLIWGAADALAHKATQATRKSIVTALQLNPLRAARPWTFQLLASSFLRQS